MKHDIDDIFKDKLNNNGLEYKESYWDSMEQLLERKKRRKTILLFSILFVTIAGGLIGFSLFLSESTTPDESILSTLEQSHPAINTKEAKGNKSEYESAEKAIVPLKEEMVKSTESNINKSTTELPATIMVQDADETSEEKPVILQLPSPSISTSIIQSQPVSEKIESVENIQLMMCGFKSSERIQPEFEIGIIQYTPSFSLVKIGEIEPPDRGVENNKFLWQYFVSTGAEYDQYSRQSENAALKKDEKTRNTFGYNLNFIAGKNHWSFRTGVGILQLAERTNYNIINKFYKYDTTYRMIDPNYGQTITGTRIALIRQKVDTTVFSSHAVNNHDARVQFNYLKVPLIASYEFRFGSFGLTLDAGLNTAILMQKKGIYTELSGPDFQLKDVKQSHDFTKVLFQTYTAAGLKYHIGSRWNIVGTYGLTQSLNSMVKSYEQKARVNFMSLGLEIRL